MKKTAAASALRRSNPQSSAEQTRNREERKSTTTHAQIAQEVALARHKITEVNSMLNTSGQSRGRPTAAGQTRQEEGLAQTQRRFSMDGSISAGSSGGKFQGDEESPEVWQRLYAGTQQRFRRCSRIREIEEPVRSAAEDHPGLQGTGWKAQSLAAGMC